MQKVNKEGGGESKAARQKGGAAVGFGAEGGGGAVRRAHPCGRARRGQKAGAAEGRRGGERAGGGFGACTLRAEGAKRARTSDRARPRSLQCPALFCGGVCLVRQRGAGMVVAEGENALPAQAVHGKVEGNAQCVHPDALRQQQRREHEPVAAVGKAA